VRAAVAALTRALTGEPTLPPHLDAALRRLEGSSWPEVVTTWSRLTPSGFPVELTAGPPGTPVHWAAEVAGPELPDPQRLGLAAELLACAGQPVDAELLATLRIAQHRAGGHAGPGGTGLRYGAWLGGREGPGAPPRLKLYSELPAGTVVAALGLPAEIGAALRGLPDAVVPRMLGVDPSAGKIELYLRLPDRDPAGLAPFLHSVGHGRAVGALERGLVDGLRRLAGRRLGLSIAAGGGPGLELALFVTARTLFAVEPDMLLNIAPQLRGLDGRWRPGPVTLGLDPSGRHLPVAVGLAPWGPDSRRTPSASYAGGAGRP
jgi:hypothetical protein